MYSPSEETMSMCFRIDLTIGATTSILYIILLEIKLYIKINIFTHIVYRMSDYSFCMCVCLSLVIMKLVEPVQKSVPGANVSILLCQYIRQGGNINKITF